ncbi:MAG: glycosyltransferase family 2 protein [Acidobacteriota bacterium]|nr:glycosyltransferase family 2 protein [Acidobacteriota bacterium]
MNTERQSHTSELGSAPVATQSPPASHGGGPLVSVITPTYNYGHLIGETFECLRSQTYTHWECVVVDDGSTDNTAEVVAAYVARDPRIKYLRQQNQFQAAARNLGLRHSAGEYVQFLDADDKIEPCKLERQVAYLEQHPEVDIIYGGVRYFTDAGIDESLHSVDEDNQPWMRELSGQGRELVSALVRRNLMVVNAPLVRRRVIDAVEPFAEPLSPVEDWDYWVRCAIKGMRFQYENLEGTLALVRAHPVSSSRNRVRAYKSVLLMRKALSRVITDDEARDLNSEQMAMDEGYLGVEEVCAGSLLRGMWRFLRAAALERKRRWRLKWLFCAAAAPFVPRHRMRAFVAASLTGALMRRGRSL